MHNSLSFRRQQLQTQALQMGVPRAVRWQTKTTLTTTLQVAHQAFLREAVGRMKRLGRVSVTEVLAPPAQIAIDFANERRCGLPTQLRSRHLAQAIPQPGERLPRWEHVQILPLSTIPVAVVTERETQEVQRRPRFAEFHHMRLLPIDGQPEAAFELRFDPLSQPGT